MILAALANVIPKYIRIAAVQTNEITTFQTLLFFLLFLNAPIPFFLSSGLKSVREDSTKLLLKVRNGSLIKRRRGVSRAKLLKKIQNTLGARDMQRFDRRICCF